MIDHFGTKKALDLNMKLEFERNQERYQFMKWGMQAFDTFGVVPPGFGIVHQVNLEYLARGVHKSKDGVVYPDTLVGTDSHTTMINGIGVVGWGVGGIEAEAGMLGQPVYFLTPDVVGFELTGKLREGVTATDLVLTVTEILRKHKVVGKFVEFFGPGTKTLALPDRATIANMAPEYGATMGFFPVDERTIEYFKGTGRTKEEIEAFEAYFKAQGLFGVPMAGDIDYTRSSSSTCPPWCPAWPAPSARRTASRSRTCEEPKFAELFSSADRRQRLQPAGRQARPRPSRPPRRHGHQERRRADRRHHQLHQHQQPRRAAGRRPAGQEGGRSGPEGAAAHQDLARAGLAHRHRIPHQGRPAALPGEARLQRRRLRLHHLHRQRRRPDARAQQADHRQRPGLRRGALGQPQLRGPHPPQPEGQLPGQPAAGGGLRHRRQRDARPDDRARGQGQGRQGRLPRRHLADQRRGLR